MWQASAVPAKPHPQPLEPDSCLPVVYMQEAVDQPRDRRREPKERKNGKRRGKSEEKAGWGGVVYFWWWGRGGIWIKGLTFSSETGRCEFVDKTTESERLSREACWKQENSSFGCLTMQ